MDKYTLIDDLTSDIMFEAYGSSIADLFVNAGEALFSIICDIAHIKPEQSIRLHLEAADAADLLHEWLSSLLTQSEIENLFLCQFRIETLQITASGCVLDAVASGESMTQAKGSAVVKGITYYGYEFEKTDNGYRARVAVDI